MDIIILVLFIGMPILNFNLAKKRGRNGINAVFYTLGLIFGMMMVAEIIAMSMSSIDIEAALNDEALYEELISEMLIPMLIGAIAGASISVLLALRKPIANSNQNNTYRSNIAQQNIDPFAPTKNVDPFASNGSMDPFAPAENASKPSYCPYCGTRIVNGNCPNCGSGNSGSSNGSNW